MPAAHSARPALPPLQATFFATPQAFGTWLRAHASAASELIVGFHKVGSGTPSITWPQAVDEALCVGWIDAVRKRIDDARYQIRFTPRKPGSTWSAVNIARVAALTQQGRMQPAGQAAFERRTEARSRTYAYEQASVAALEPAEDLAFRKHRSAWAFFEAQAPSYRQRLLWWIASAKRPETRRVRLDRLIEASQDGRRL